MKTSALLLSFAVAAASWGVGVARGASSRPVPFEQDGQWGYRSGKSVVIPPQYAVAWEFSREGIAAVVDSGGWATIDRTGRVLVRPFVFDNGPDDFHEGLARCVEGGKIGFFDRRGRIVVAPRFDFAFPFSRGLAKACLRCVKVQDGEHSHYTGGRWFYIDRKGKRLEAP